MKSIIKFIIALVIYIYIIFIICKFILFSSATLLSSSHYLKDILAKISDIYLDIKIIIVKLILNVITLIKYVIEKIF